MGTLKTWTLTGTPGVNLIAGDADLPVVNPDGGTIKYATGGGVEFITDADGGYTIARGEMAADDPAASFLGTFVAPAAPAADLSIGYVARGVTNDGIAIKMVLTTGMALHLWDAANNPIGGGSLATLTAGTQYQITITANSTAGAFTARLYSAAGAHIGTERSASGENLGAQALSGFEIGVVSQNPATSVLWRSIKMEDGRTSEIPPSTPPPAPSVSGFTAWDGMVEQHVTASVFDGTTEVAASAYMMPNGYTDAASMINSAGTFYVAHRGGSLDWPEMSMRAYTNAAAWGAGALEISANRTSDGVWVGVHDIDLTRTSPGAPSTPIGDMTWAEVQAWTNSGEPYARLEDILDAYGSSHVLFLDPKFGGWDMDGFCGLILDRMPAANAVIKFFYTATTVADAAHDHGLLTWGYYYQDSAADIPSTHGPWDVLGMDYTADQASWDLALATGKKVIGHIVPDAAGATTAVGKGAAGLMVSGVTAVVPGPVVPI